MNGVIKVIEKAAYVLSVLIGIVIANSCTIFDSRPTAAERRRPSANPNRKRPHPAGRTTAVIWPAGLPISGTT